MGSEQLVGKIDFIHNFLFIIIINCHIRTTLVRAGKIRLDYGRNEASELDEGSCKKENRAAMETGL